MLKRLLSLVTFTVALTVSGVINVAVLLCSSTIHGSGSSVKVCCSGVLCGLAVSFL